ncbi:M20 family metallopeptidase [Aminobacterium sp. MB27-C1]|uniref:M20 metallopeptidase family protein n=1 Tax=unclassified Aminobacterium TaxID=2685012 RepID=UPI0027DE2CB7|nr:MULTISPECIES: M20 family metallopeptidase [unclassified Aminobacterium]MEA4877980.1 M20 family metallopeptidase [Aminobacterium sp.]WMI71589.1 M20 family metallopeptidase [Aminobacterium sp. MB27-C1]
MASEILQKALDIKEYIVEAKRKIHREPELSMKEFATTAFVQSELKKMGVEMIPLGSNVGVLGIIKGEKKGEGKVIALRADMDALPIQETTDIPDKSIVSGVMHACGHDCHTAMLLGAAKLLMSMKDRFSGTVKLLFQPAEENLDGSKYMIDQGVLDNPKVDYILGLHGHSSYNVGEIALREGPYMASSDFFTAKITGKSGHGAYPHRIGCDPILAASNCVMAIQSIITRQIDALDNLVISICEIHGGTAKNIIPETVEFSGSIRCQNMEVRNSIEQRIRDVIEGVASSYKCKAELDYHYGVPPLSNSPEVVEIVRTSAKKVIGSENVKYIDIPAMGSEDFSRYLEVVPKGVFARMGICVPGKNVPVFHNGNFIFPEEALPYGTALFVQFVIDAN